MQRETESRINLEPPQKFAECCENLKGKMLKIDLAKAFKNSPKFSLEIFVCERSVRDIFDIMFHKTNPRKTSNHEKGPLLSQEILLRYRLFFSFSRNTFSSKPLVVRVGRGRGFGLDCWSKEHYGAMTPSRILRRR